MSIRIHAYTKVSLAAAGANLLLNLGLLALLLGRSPYFPLLAIDNVFATGFLSMVSAGLGIHALIKVRWPGDSVYDRAHRPGRGDVLVVGIALLLTLVNLAALLAGLEISSAAFHGA